MKHLNRIAILVIAAAGLALVAGVSARYSSGSLGIVLCVLIAVGLVAGIAELVVREGQARRTLAELAALPRPAPADIVDRVSPGLGRAIQARLAGQTAGAPVGFAPFLVGLLVTLGLLGTFLGLVDALQGARSALAGSGEVDALRTGLAAPMYGLTLAFGASIAGIGASLALGLATVFARRVEARVGAELAAYVAGPMAHLAPGARELAALETLVQQLSGSEDRQKDALPRAAEALERLAGRMDESLRDVAAEVRSQAAAQAESSARAIQGLSDKVENSIGAQVEALTVSAEMSARAIAELGARVEESTHRAGAELGARAERASEEMSVQVRTLGQLLGGVAERMERSIAAQVGGLAAAAETTAQAVAGVAGRMESGLAGLSERVERGVAGEMHALLGEAEAMRVAMARLVEQVGGETSAAVAAASERMHATVTGQVEALVGAAEGSARMLADLAARIDDATAKATERMELAVGLQSEGFADGLRRTQEAWLDAQRERQLEWMRGLEDRQVEWLDAQAARQDHWITTQGARLDASLSAQMALGERLAEVATAAQTGTGELGAAATAFTAAIEHYHEASGRWTDAIGRMELALENYAKDDAEQVLSELLDRVRESMGESMQVVGELFAEVRAFRTAQAEAAAAPNLPAPEAQA